jgi:uncharacterized protein DUF4203
MTREPFFALVCVSLIGLLFGSILAFGGYRFFLFLLPIWGFFYGFGLGAETIQALFGTGFLSDVTSWVVGFGVALIFALLSYLFYFFAVALIAGSLGYAIGAGLMMAIGFDFGFLVWLVGIIAGIVVAFAVLALNVQKWVIIIATALLGAGVIVGTFMFVFGNLPPEQLFNNPVRAVLQSSPLWMLIFLAIAALGAFGQYQTARHVDIASYNRWTEINQPTTV